MPVSFITGELAESCYFIDPTAGTVPSIRLAVTMNTQLVPRDPNFISVSHHNKSLHVCCPVCRTLVLLSDYYIIANRHEGHRKTSLVSERQPSMN